MLIPLRLFNCSPVVVVHNHWHLDSRVLIFNFDLLFVLWRSLSAPTRTVGQIETLSMSSDLPDMSLIPHVGLGHVVLIARDPLRWLHVPSRHFDVVALVNVGVHLSLGPVVVTQFR